jgi:hypothetical protein
MKLILPLLYGCETWCLTLREEHRLKELDNMMLRGINEKFHSLYSFQSIIRMKSRRLRRLRWFGRAGRMEDNMNACGIFVAKLEGKRPLGRPYTWVGGYL